MVGDGPQGSRGQAEWFVPRVSGNLKTITLALKGNKAASTAIFSIAQDNQNIPGMILESFPDVRCPEHSNASFPAIELESKTHPMLRAGVKYWICAEPVKMNAGCAWYYNKQGLASGFAYQRSQWGWAFAASGSRNGAFRVTFTTPQPERQ
jgi:hypothetical protein